jgi:hypothetical protein
MSVPGVEGLVRWYCKTTPRTEALLGRGIDRTFSSRRSWESSIVRIAAPLTVSQNSMTIPSRTLCRAALFSFPFPEHAHGWFVAITAWTVAETESRIAIACAAPIRSDL